MFDRLFDVFVAYFTTSTSQKKIEVKMSTQLKFPINLACLLDVTGAYEVARHWMKENYLLYVSWT
jgi:hypothetical protein